MPTCKGYVSVQAHILAILTSPLSIRVYVVGWQRQEGPQPDALSKIRLASEVCVCVFGIHKFHKLYTSFPLQGDPGPEGLRGLPGMVGPQVR